MLNFTPGKILRVRFLVLNATFNNISAYLGGQIFFVEGNRSARRKPSTCRKLLTNFII